jgi:hypothetical protein
MEKSYRIHTNISTDTILNVNMKQDFDFMEILSLKLTQNDSYRLHSSNYGVIIGRVLANDAFGIPNAKVSIFIERDMNDPVDMENIYPYSEVTSTDDEGRRYNLLPDYSDDDCYRVVGTFPDKRYLLDDDIQLEVYDKYYKYTTVTNNAGDYMIFGVPSGNQTLHVDIDLSDIGILSQKPRDFTYRGYDLSEFDSPSQFKESTNLDSLTQIFSQDKSVYVYPFWGDATNGIAAITRCDIQIAYKFEPTCVFMGSIISDNEGNSIGHRCAPNVNNGMNEQLVAGQGTIEMIRKTTDGLVEEYPIQGNALIDSDGVWCYQIPMNLDYVGTDEYGNIVPTDNPKKGIPTRTQVRFRFSKTETGDEGFSRHTAKYLVPMNPVTYEGSDKAGQVVPMTQEQTGVEIEKMYNFGSATPQSCFRDLYWNNVYSVKNFIPKIQVAYRPYAPNYSALKGSNLVEDQNPVPFNKLRIDIPFTYMIVCILFTIVMIIIHFINTLIWIIQRIRGLCLGFKIFGKRIEICPFKVIIPKFGCIPLSAGLTEGNVAYYPGCHCPDSDACRNASCPEDMEGDCVKSSDNSELKDKIQQNLAKDYKIIKLDFYQDWLNGSLYMPLWYWRKRKKKKFLFFTISGAKNEFCDCDKTYSKLKTFVTCNMVYKTNGLGTDNKTIDLDEDRWHKRRAQRVWFKNGVIKGVENRDGLTAYYYTAYQANREDKADKEILQRTNRFLYVRLYATDIILLGNLNENNLYGIPQLYTALPSTTANIPPIASVEESLTDNEKEKSEVPRNDTAGDSEDSGTTITTGMDWGHEGGSQVPRYRKGLFMDLACAYAATRSKSCINVERLSELGVNPDMKFKMSYSENGNEVKTGAIDADGFINKYELDDMDNRAAFATLNHIGFIPQDYQDSIDSYTTQIQDENTGYLVPKFKYIYPVDFDGRLELIMKTYKRGFEQATYDMADDSYVTFRLGAEGGDKPNENSEKRIRHYYFTDNGFDMPLYNNSFYFYFGINKGSTAIDKFNKMFYAPCFQRNKKPFTLDFSFIGRSYCPSVYTNSPNYKGYAYIRVTLDDIQIPYTYKLYDSTGLLIIEENEMKIRDFVIGGTIDENGEVVSNENGEIKYQKDGSSLPSVGGINYLTNQEYTLVVTDANGRSLGERIKISMPKINVNYETQSLGTKFYNTGTTRIDYICTDDTEFYGRLRILSFNVDSNEFTINNAEVIGYADDKYIIRVTGTNIDNSDEEHPVTLTTVAIIRLSIIDVSDGRVTKDCLCDTSNSPTALQQAVYSIRNTERPHWIIFEKVPDSDEVHPTFLVYQPNRFIITISQFCDGKELEDNVTSDIVNVNNGEKFNTFVGSAGDTSMDMPVKFMLGSVNDSQDPSRMIAPKSYFYSLEGVDLCSSPTAKAIKGWYGLHQEDTYQFHRTENQVLLKNSDTWTDFVTLNEDINTHSSKATILAYKFNAMFSLAAAAYVVTDTATIYHTARGGIHPTLYRSVVPMYTDEQKFLRQYVLNDSNSSTVIGEYPMIVGRNYFRLDGPNGDNYGPMVNPYYQEPDPYTDCGGDRAYLGNYFAAFTQNGGYSSKTKVDYSIKVMKIPNYTKVTPMTTSTEKQIGKDIKGQLTANFLPAYNQYQIGSTKYYPYLRTLFVDRRFDYRFILFAPSMSNSLSLYEAEIQHDEHDNAYAKADPMERVWKSARISGETFNGVEMSYDTEYNIISADTSVITDEEDPNYGAITAATPNRRLEYSYNFSDTDEDAKTQYNIPNPAEVIWDTDVDENGNIVPGQIVKRFYEATYSGFDIRNYFWSSFNRNRLSAYTYSDVNDIKGREVPYVYKYPADNPTLYNGDFNRESVNVNYPTHRFIDVGNIPPAEVHDFSVLPCSYEINAYKDTDGSVKAEADYTDGVSFYDTYKPPVVFMPPNADSNDYGNVCYNKKSEGAFVRFESVELNLYFKYAEKSADGFKIYTALPRLLQVLDYVGNPAIDGISYIKTATKSSQDMISNNQFGSLKDLLSMRSNPAIFYEFGKSTFTMFSGMERDTILPNNTKIYGSEEDGLYHHDGTHDFDKYVHRTDTDNDDEEGKPNAYLTSDSNDFLNVKFKLSLSLKGDLAGRNIQVFTILVHREYFCDEDNKLKHQLSVIEHGDLYDIRYLEARVNQEDGADVKTYVEKIKLSPGTIDGDAYNVEGTTTGSEIGSGTIDGKIDGEDVTIEVDDTNMTVSNGHMSGGKGKVSGDSQSYALIQTITFDFKFNPLNPPTSRQCEAFGNYSMMAYTFRFENSKGDVYDIDKVDVTTTPPVVNETTDPVIIHFKMKWTQDMGILGDKEWNGNNTQVTIFAKTQENFVYKLNKFRLVGVEQPGYNSSTKKADFDENIKKKTTAKIDGQQ